MGDTLNASANGYEISITNLTYTHREGASPSLSDVNIHLPKGSRTILVGANGGKHIIAINKGVAMLTTCGCIRDFSRLAAGKSTLLQILAGKRLISSPGTDVSIKGRDVFRQTPDGITFLGTEWCADLKLGTLICRQASEGFLCLQCTDSDPLMTTGR